MTGEESLSPTEQRNPATAEMDLLKPPDLVRLLLAENRSVSEAVERAAPAIARAVEEIARRLEAGGRLFYAGAGTSGRIGVLDASECPPTFGVPAAMVQGLIAGGDEAIRNSVEGAEDDFEAARRDLAERGLSARDAVVAIAASGRTPYAIGAIGAAKEAGALAVAVTNVSGSPLEAAAEIAIVSETGPEPLAGSTRMKAGTAQKTILNTISTAIMVLLGKTYGNLMVDVQASNEKLRGRAIRIVMEATGDERDKAELALGECGWHAKTAIVMLISGVDATAASARLHRARGRVRAALEG